MHVIGIIPARGGSKGIIRKNLYPLCGKPLIDYTIEAACASYLDNYLISTDDPEIAKRCGAILRPAELARDDTPMLPVIQHAVRAYYGKVDAVMILQPTSPLRTAADINEALRLFVGGDADSLYSGYYLGIKGKEPYDKYKTKPHFQRNGAIFLTRCDLLNKGKLWSDDVLEYEMPKSRSVDVDDMDDMFICECLLSKGRHMRCPGVFCLVTARSARR